MSNETTDNKEDQYIILKILNIFLLCLVLIDKSIENNSFSDKSNSKSYESKLVKQADFQPSNDNDDYAKNYGREVPTISEKYTANKSKKPPEENLVSVYYIRYSAEKNQPEPDLVKVKRKAGKNLKQKIKVILKALIQGPNLQEQKSGISNSIPLDLAYHKKVKISKGVIHISFTKELGAKANINTLKDRIDQLTYSLLSIEEVKGIKLYIDYVPVRTIGEAKFPIPSILTKRTRKVISL
ncbi:MAG: GerMN domain-containing protein [Leptospiraceae bacterium]|nr:GerMN domain-containing protein [Leptospiraceae bacterium]MCP5493747.1 GerMN domain-containing protein [Leptospiraceae bacterium]